MEKRKSMAGGVLAFSGLILSLSGLFNSRIRSLMSAGAFGISLCALFLSFTEKGTKLIGAGKRQ
ncbi:MAG: hypothetical protein E7487_07425 [Ruminococcaceae bacterium]|nr:hypothetical protein [Oscillospiraceae bacterium]